MKAARKSVDRAWFVLFDVEYLARTLSTLNRWIAELEPGQGLDEARTIQRMLIEPIDAYLDDHWQPKGTTTNVQAAERFREELERLCEMLRDVSPFRELDARLSVSRVRPLWFEFVAVHAAPLVWLIPLKASKSASVRRAATGLTDRAIASFCNANLSAKKSDVVEGLREMAAMIEFAAKCSDDTIAAEVRTCAQDQNVKSVGSQPALQSCVENLEREVAAEESANVLAAQGKGLAQSASNALVEKRLTLAQLRKLLSELRDPSGKRPISVRTLNARIKALEVAGSINVRSKVSKT